MSDNVHCKVLLLFTLVYMADFVDFLVQHSKLSLTSLKHCSELSEETNDSKQY